MGAHQIHLTLDATAHLKLYGPKTYGIALPRDVAVELQEARLVEWLPGPSWAGTIYGLTGAGAAYLDQHFASDPRPSKAEGA